MRTLWISLCVALIIAFVEAQKNLNFPKPVVSLEKRSHPPIWRRPPEERRKLPLFPKNNKKFVVTEKSTLKNEVTKPMVTTKRPLMRKLFVKDKIDERTWSFPQREPMKPKQFNVPVAPHPKRDYNRHYKVKADEKIAEPSTVKTFVTSVKTESSANKVLLNRGNLIQVLNKINAYTNKTSSKQANKVIHNNDSVKVNLPVTVFTEPATDVNADSVIENMAATKINVQVDKATEKVFLSKRVDNVIQNNRLLNASSFDTVSEEYVDESEYESSKANVTQTTINDQLNKTAGKVFLSKQVANVMQNYTSLNASALDTVSEEYVDESGYESNKANVTHTTIKEQLNKTAGKVFLSKQVDNVMQNNKLLNASALDTVSEEYVDESDYETSEANVTQTANKEQLNKTAGKVFLSKQVDNVVQNNKSLNTSSFHTVFEEYVDESDYKSNKANVTHTTIKEQLNKTAGKVFLSKQVDNVMQNNKLLNTSSFHTVSEEYLGESDYETSEANVTQTTNNEQLNKTAEELFLSNQVDNVMQNNTSVNASLLDTVSEEYIDEIDYESSEAKTVINETLNKTAEKVSLSKQTDNTSQNNDPLKVNVLDNVSDKYVVDERDSRGSHATLATLTEMTNDEENESKIIHNTYTKKPFSPSEPLEARSVDTNDLELNDQNDPSFFRLDGKQSSNEKTGDFSKLEELETLMKVISKDTSSHSDHKLSKDSNNTKTFSVPIQDINEEPVKSQPQKLEEMLNNFYKEKPVIENESKISTENNVDATVIEVTDKYENGNIEIKTDYTNTETNRNNIVNDLQNLIEVIKSTSTLSESKADIADSQLLKLDLNIVEEYSGRSDTISAGYDETTLESRLYDSLSESPIEITFDNLKTLSAEEKSEEPILVRPVSMIIEQNTAGQITDKNISMDNDSVTGTTENIGDGNTSIFSDIINVNMDEKINENIANSSTIDNFHDLSEVIKHKSAVGDYSEEAIGGTQLVNLYINTVEEYSDKPSVITTELDETTQAFYLSDGSLTESPIEIVFGSQDVPKKEKDSVEPAFYENLHKIIDKSVINELIETDEIIPKINDPTTEVPLQIDDECSENNENSPIIITLPNLDEVLGDNLYVGDNSEVAIGGTEFLKYHINIVDGDIDKPHAIKSVVDETLVTKQDYIEREHETATSAGILFDEREPPSTDLSLDAYTNKINDEPVTDELVLTQEVTGKVQDSVKNFSLKLENTNNTSQSENLTVEKNGNEPTDLLNLIDFINDDDESNFGLTTEVAITATQLNLHINIAEANSDKPNTIAIALDGSTQKNYVNGQHVDHASIGILFQNLELISPNNEQLNIPINVISHESVTNQPSLGDEDIQMSDKSINFIDNVISDEWLVNSSNLPNDNSPNKPIISKSNNPKDKGVFNESNIDGEEISSEENMDNSINSSNAISNESFILTNVNGSGSTLEEMFEIMIAQSDHSRKLGDGISNETYVLNDSLSSVVTQEEISDYITADKSENITDEISNESHILNDSSSGIVTQEEISDEMTADHTKNVTDKIPNKSHVFNESSSSLVTTEEISEEITTDKSRYITDAIPNESNIINDSSSNIGTQEEISGETTADPSENLTDEISNESYVLNDSFSSRVTTEKIFNKTTHDESENLTDEISNESHIFNDSSSSLVTTEEIFDEIRDDESEYLTDEVSNESPLEVIQTSDVKSKESAEQSKNVTVEDASNEPAIDIRHPSTELASNEMLAIRIKRSNNIIEEENLATTLSSFKYTGHGTRLDHDLRFKNINA